MLPTPAQQIAFQEYVRTVSERTELLRRLETELLAQTKTWRFSPVVEAQHALRGVQFTVAITTLAELGDLTRFDAPRPLMRYLGLTPSEYSSGDRRRLGGIPRAGNGHARRVLIEAAKAYRHRAKVSEQIQARQQQLPKSLRDIAGRAQVRLCGRYRQRLARGKHPNTVAAAIARELVPSCGRSRRHSRCRRRAQSVMRRVIRTEPGATPTRGGDAAPVMVQSS